MLRRRGYYLIAFASLIVASCVRPVPIASVQPGAPRPVSRDRDRDRDRDHDKDDHKKPGQVAAPGKPDRDEDDGDDENAERAGALDAYRFFLAQRVRAGETGVPIERYQAARERARQMGAFSFGEPGRAGVSERAQIAGSSSSGGWTNLGPGNIGGRTRSILIDPTSPSTIYAGAVTGGVWKTTDGGATWNPLTDLLPVLNIGALAMDPTNHLVIYAGTGESYTNFEGQGIFKTADGGATWTQLAATSGFTYTNKIVMSVNHAQRIYAATSTGVWTSPDGGTTWTQSLGSLANGCQDLALRTDKTTDYLFASCTGATYSDDYGIWRNQDVTGSGTWALVQTTPHMIRTSLALAPSQQSTIYAMAASLGGTAGYDNGLLAVFKSTSNGDSGTWATTVSNTDPNLVNTELLSSLSCTAGSAYGQGWYDNVLAVDPSNPSVVWAGGVNLFRSNDGGVNWTAIPPLQESSIVSQQGIHADQHAIVFHPNYNGTTNQTMFVGNDGGIFRTNNALGAAVAQPSGACPPATLSVTWSDLNTSYVATQYYHGAAYPGGGVYFGGAQDNGVSRGTDVAGPGGWSWLWGGDGGSVAIDPADANTIFWSDQNLALQRSTDNGLDFAQATSGITETNFPFIAALGADPNNGEDMFLGGDTNLWRTVDGANSWTAAAAVEADSSVTAVTVSPRDSNTVLFGTATGKLYRNSGALSSSGSSAWLSATPRSGSVGGIAFDWQNPNVIYATYSTFNYDPGDAHVYKSVNGGVTWTASDGSGANALPDVPAFRLVVNPYNSSMLFVGTDLGVFVSTDGGGSWLRGSSPFSDVITEELALDQGAQSNWLFAFTYGRGAYRVALPGAISPQCSYSVNPTTINSPAWGGIYPVTVTAPVGCAWVTLPGSDASVAYVQSPAGGSGNGTAWVVAEPANFAATPQTLTIAGQAVTVNETSSFGTSAGDLITKAASISVPGTSYTYTQNFTSSVGDPVHSCTGSADTHTAWWKITPTASGTVQVQGLGRRANTYGNYGLVLTAYPGTTASEATELGCAALPLDTTGNVYGFLTFAVNAGSTYLIEASAAGSTTDVGNTTISVTSVSGKIGVSVTPAQVQLAAGGSSQQFTANVSNGPNPAVRWSLSPATGTITPEGLYTPPVAGSPVSTVTLTASAFANPQVTASATINIAVLQTISFPALSNAAFGSGPVTLNATASSGLLVSYSPATPVVCSVSGSTVKILASGGCTITATQMGNTTYAAATPVSQSFTVFFADVAPTDYYYAAINALVQRGITAGCGSNGYCPLQNVTRDDMAIFVVRAIYGGDNFTYSTTPAFTDVPASYFAFKWIQKLAALGITGGCGTGLYCPTTVVTRDQMAIFIERARLGLTLAGGASPAFTYSTTPAFTDVPVSEFAFPWIQRLAADNITAGCGMGTYCPSTAVIRGDMAIFLMRGAFNQFLPAGTPIITSISPSVLPIGTSGTFTIAGVNTNFVQGTTQLSAIPGVTVGSITVNSATSMTVQLTAAANAVAQPYSVVAITGSEQDVLPNGLVLQ